jgi:MFS family permease
LAVKIVNVRSIIALNIVSVLAQFGQYGLGTTLIPIGLKVRNATPANIGITSAAFWLGMLVGLIIAGQVTRKLGFRKTLICGVLTSSISFALMPQINWHFWAIPAALIGFGTGLRWISLETWLYSLVPADARGRIVGIHETVLGIAAILGALLVVVIDASKPDAFWLAAVVMLIGFIPLKFATTISTHPKELQTSYNANIKYWLGFGAIVAGLGGYVEGSILALLPVYSADIGLNTKDAAWLLTIFQIGAMTFQFPIGWMVDHYGLIKTTKLCAAIAFASLLFIASFDHALNTLLMAIFILGGVIAGTLSLGIIWAIQNNTGSELTQRVRQVSIVYTLLSATGPFVSGLVVGHIGSNSLFWQQLVVIFVLILVLFKQRKNPENLTPITAT